MCCERNISSQPPTCQLKRELRSRTRHREAPSCCCCPSTGASAGTTSCRHHILPGPLQHSRSSTQQSSQDPPGCPKGATEFVISVPHPGTSVLVWQDTVIVTSETLFSLGKQKKHRDLPGRFVRKEIKPTPNKPLFRNYLSELMM